MYQALLRYDYAGFARHALQERESTGLPPFAYQALLTAEAIARDGLQLAGWVANIIGPKTSRLEENLATLAERLPAPCLGRVPKLKHAGAAAVAEYLELDLLD